MAQHEQKRKGQMEQLHGKAKQAQGELTGSEKQKAKGKAEEAKGKGRQAGAELTHKAKQTAKEVKHKMS